MHNKQLSAHKVYFYASAAVAVCFVLVGCVRGNGGHTTTPATPGGAVAVIDSNIIVNQPLSNSTVKSPFTISGRARVPEGTVLVYVSDANDVVLATTTTQASDASPLWGTYSTEINFPTPSTSQGFLGVYVQNPDTGAEQNVIKIPIRFAEYQLPIVQVFFSNIQRDPNLLSCDVVYSTTREVAQPEQRVMTALTQLLAGPTEDESKEGFISSLPETGVVVNSINLKDGVFTVDFNQALQAGVAGSCRVQAIRAQITQTLLQFDGVTDVVISVEGKSEAILQP